ncbi:MAG: efflux RND transporter periplasmic adaptor subunit [Candidatus Edwardsbacteria bacterium]|nr:efflux RND transporter periplasmic adaptor subunit [Candidatus Edwardsbacteria bacterium]MBU1577106.1 efflux RND transporter periplasmic adaptor subunit [Candidatus Edwardsbacteria bacterium]MBU2463557.1 efflux RND transporter periplasmic adaptor subunit [Candidatus Edwardsbacteria bacterium]MBU2594038.1 efflux RND transporter periplasmic adaptor subunit [Candidatus Edwardsbacteria bacterium]
MINFKSKKLWIITAAVLLVAILVVSNIVKGTKKLTIQSAKVKKGEIVSIVSAPGNVKAETEVQISAYVMGKVSRLPVKEGDLVKKGQILVQIDPTSYAAQVKQSRASLDLAKANLAQTELIYKRKQELFAAGLISQEENEATTTQFNLDQARLTQAEASLEQAQDTYSKTTITSPINGTVVQLNVEVGEVVVTGTMNNAGSVIMVVADMSQMEVESQVDESDVKDIKIGQPVEIEVDAIVGKTFKGEVSEVGNAAISSGTSSSSNASVNYTVKARFTDKSDYLKSGMSANVDITTSNKKDILLIPIQSVVMRKVDSERKAAERKKGKGGALAGENTSDGKRVKEKEQEVVYVVEKGKAVIMPVETGVSDQDNIEVLAGLSDGQEVIKGPFSILRNLKHSDKVKVTKDQTAGKQGNRGR